MVIVGNEIFYSEEKMAKFNEMMTVVDCSKDGRCSDCGQCCTNLLPVNFQEISRIAKYIKDHNVQPCSHFAPFSQTQGDMICPFRDSKNRRCTIYPVRPWVCKKFFCGNTRDKIAADRASAYRRSTVEIDMRATFFGGDSVAEQYIKAQLAGGMK